MEKSKDIYEIFGCKDKFELYNLVKKEPEKLQDLLGFFNIWKGAKIVQREPLNSFIKARDFISGLGIPQKNEAWVIFTGTKLEPVYGAKIRIDNQEELRKEVINGIQSGAVQVFLYYPESLKKEAYFTYFREQFKLLDLEIVDQFVYRKDNYLKKNMLFSAREAAQVEYKKSNQLHIFTKEAANSAQFNDFLRYYGNKELVGLNIERDREKIKDILKTAYQMQTQELFGYMAYDEAGNIYEVDEIFAGTRNRSLIDTKILLDKIYRAEQMKGIAVFHNHPSGNYTPSPEDDIITQKIFALAAHMEFEFADHMIAAKEGIYSYAEENPDISKAIGQFARQPQQIKEEAMEYKTETKIAENNYEELKNHATYEELKRNAKVADKNLDLKEIVGQGVFLLNMDGEERIVLGRGEYNEDFYRITDERNPRFGEMESRLIYQDVAVRPDGSICTLEWESGGKANEYFKEYQTWEQEASANELQQEAKKEIISFINREYEYNYEVKDFEEIYPDIEKVTVAQMTTPDRKYEISYVLDLKNKTWKQTVNDHEVAGGDFESTKDMVGMLKESTFEEMLTVSADDLEREFGLREDRYGCFVEIEEIQAQIGMER